MIVSHFSLQKEDAIKHTNVKCHVFTLIVNLLTKVHHIGNKPHNITEHTHAKN